MRSVEVKTVDREIFQPQRADQRLGVDIASKIDVDEEGITESLPVYIKTVQSGTLSNPFFKCSVVVVLPVVYGGPF